ncbi:ParB/RepB/Spo0J family partition protein [Mucilaginibacter jinjuensis]|uniref:ParB/RepB/Spo0J family partition protein n=1 Tax=Mucilaginibacter jinjuensis TaxID=1176721 RepID=A0ABY7T579_9SPHI|nr:ParB/RepB/Spo0J family partition protein [Mucilaginibacter jinjuensis]WCT11501.1 ParB/RepB/Spo0J family partition protein [Mucilaginibacter jinjuensis]
MSADKKRALGRGLSALLDDTSDNSTATAAVAGRPQQPHNVVSDSDLAGAGSVNEININEIEVNPFQPRTEFEPEALQELSDSIKLQGLIQPITVRRVSAHHYQLISGERRLRASKLAGLKHIPAYVRSANDQQMLEMALIENIQRENLNAIEVALSFQRMLDECNLKQEELGERVSKNRSTVTNYLRLLRLPPAIQAAIRDGQVTMGHAKALITINDPTRQLYINQQIIEQGLSVRKVEEMVRAMQKAPEKKESRPAAAEGLSFQMKKIQDDLASKFSTRVQLKVDQKGKGAIEIPFLSADDLHRILEMLDW